MVYVRNFLDAYWEKVDVGRPNDCWEWTGARYHDDYGALGIRRPDGRKTTMRAHAFALVLATGQDAAGRFALHSCDNPPCCNPRHLRWGDQKDNIADMDARGRSNRPVMQGSAHPQSKLLESDVRAIRTLYGRGYTQQWIADQFGLAQFTVSSIVRRKTWTHVL